MTMQDVLVVGAGSTGIPIAVRLSDDPSLSILLLEAGVDHREPAVTAPDLLDGLRLAAMVHDWHYSAEAAPGRRIPYRRGKTVGGTSAINAAAAAWPRPADIEAWCGLGNPAWSWTETEPWLRRIESDCDAPDVSLHGQDGPLPIRRFREDALIPFQRAFADACREALGLPAIADHNDVRLIEGVGPWPMNLREGGVRASTMLAWLGPARGRKNLTVRSEVLVDRVLMEKGRASGVVLASGEVLRARRAVVLSAGALGTPAILLRSGIGPAAELADLGITPALNRPGVGARLYDHPAVAIRLLPRPGEAKPARDPRFQAVARTATRSGAPVFLVPVSFLDIAASPALVAEAGGAPVVSLVNAALMAPRGHGRLRLAGPDPSAAPVIELDLLRDPQDMSAMMDALRLAWRVATAVPVAAVTRGIAGMDAATVASDDLLGAYARANVGTFNHPCGTAPMGPASDPMAVADERGQVRGLDGLWIADASIMPRGLSVPPNFTLIAMGERIAAGLLAEFRGRRRADA
ncbi:GMC family oxidoreductase [Falsiroseomonas sp. HW251]|uniref:GMC family oxidoreductase n=1 Tax=Falsiroseomonas sp. HW251 TaxID=3390998 RepID=UPI003D31A310